MKHITIKEDIAKDILEKNLRREYKSLSKHACLSSSAYRFGKEKIPDKINIRPSFFHDTDKIIHSLAYTRYIDKTQVFYLFENDHITHRVLHVQLVSKIARVIGRALSLNEDLIDAIALAHDLGHVPYGHDGEKKLQEITFEKTKEYFCHNAQSVRTLEYIGDKGKGLNLTLQVLDGILCHNGEAILNQYNPVFDKTPEKHKQEYKDCWNIKDSSKKIMAMTMEGCAMRIADIIAYIGRDFEDAIILGIINREDIPKSVSETIGNTNASIINNIVLDLINNSYDKPYIELSSGIFEAMSEFYKFNIDAIYQHPAKTSQDGKIRNMFDVLYEVYLDDLKKNGSNTSISQYYLQAMDSSYRDITSDIRIVCDYIAGMTDDFFNKEFEKIMIPQSFGYKLISS